MCDLTNLTPGQRDALLNAGLQNALVVAQNLGAAYGGAQGGVLGVLTNPFEVPMQLVYNGSIVADSTKTYFFIDDAIGLGTAYGQVDGDGANAGIEFTVGGGLDTDNVKKFLQTHALIITGYNFQASIATLLSNNLRIIYCTLDGNTKSKQMFSAQSVSNMQQNPNLLNVDQSFVYTNNGSLKIPVTADADDTVTYSFTFKIGGAVPYGKLDEYLAYARIPERSRMSC
jgi:hypothetical protein